MSPKPGVEDWCVAQPPRFHVALMQVRKGKRERKGNSDELAADVHGLQASREGIRSGKSWIFVARIFFTWIWALVKRLPGLAALLFLGLLFADGFAEASRSPVLGLVLALGVATSAGSWGNQWRRKSLWKRGYRMVEEFKAESPEAAITAALDREKSPAAEPHEDERLAA